MNYKLIIRKILLFCVQTCIKILWIMPIKKNKIMFISFSGQYSDSPKYIYLELKKLLGDDYCYSWVLSADLDDNTLDNAIKVPPTGLQFWKEFVTSRIIITNDYLNTYAPIRKEQYVLNTWHGGSPLKAVGMVNSNISENEKYFFKVHDKKYSAYIASSSFMAKEVIRKSFGYHGTIISCGLPRNSVLFQPHEEQIKKVKRYFKLPLDKDIGLVLYAPTFRGNHKKGYFLNKKQHFKIKDCIDTLEKKYHKKFYFIFRAHHSFTYAFDSEDYLPATNYPDMQELLCASDVLITDYSSCMGDMCLMNKPAFLYTPDLEQYIADRGFYWNIDSLPFPVAKTPEQMYKNILEFDETLYRQNVMAYLSRLGSYENADSAKTIANILMKELEKKI